MKTKKNVFFVFFLVLSIFLSSFVSYAEGSGLSYTELYSIPSSGIRSLYISEMTNRNLPTSALNGVLDIPSTDQLENYISTYGDFFTLDSSTFDNQISVDNHYTSTHKVVDVSDYHTVVRVAQGASSPIVMILRFENDDICIVNNYLVAPEPINCYFYLFRYNNGNFEYNVYNPYVDPCVNGLYNTVSTIFTANTYYDIHLDAFASTTNYNFDTVFTDIPIYFTSSDNSSGLANPITFTFDNLSSYVNYNYLTEDNIIAMPGAEDPLNEEAISNLMFRDSTFYGGSDIKKFYHLNYLTFNEFQLNHPEYFVVNFDYMALYKDDSMSSSVTFRYKMPGASEYGRSIRLDALLGYMTRFGKPLGIELSSNHFVNTNNSTLSYYINLTQNRVTGINVDAADPDGIFENVVNGLDNLGTNIGNFLFGSDSVSNLSSLLPSYESVIDIFKVSCHVSVSYIGNTSYSSGDYVDEFDFLSGSTNIVVNTSGENLYPSNESTNLPVPSNGENSTSVNTGGGSIANATGGNVTFQGIIQRVFEPFALDTVTVAGVGDNWNYMIRSIQDSSDNGFWGVLKETYQIIPDEIWGWLIASVAAILGCAVFRFYITSIRC